MIKSLSETSLGSTVVPCFRYRDGPAAIEWLCEVFGFRKHAVHANNDGTIAHAQLTLQHGMIMVSSYGDTEYSKLVKHPDEIGNTNTQGPYVIVEDTDAVYARAKTAGATILIELRDESYGGRHFTCRDLEGYIWSIGSYNPWQSPAEE